MGIERLAPTSIVSSSANASGAVTDIDESPDAPDGNWITASTKAFLQIRVDFSTPANTPQTGADLQAFRVWARRTNNSFLIPKITIRLYESGVYWGDLISNVEVNSTTGEMFTGLWDADNLSTSSGADVECRVQCNPSGGSTSDKNTVDIGALEWVCQNSVAPVLDVGAVGG